jgi:2-polyprenyl-3-methyl-5-hydroxy-6-metoxy-1,4-benzoquinol methylase
LHRYLENIEMHQGSARDHDPAVFPLRGRALSDVVAPTVDLDDLNNPHTLAVLSVPPGATVLDIGCGPGVVARALAARGCKVWGLEIDPRKAALARQHCVDVLEGDVEAVTLSTAFGAIAFDFVLCLDVLEHLRDPTAALVNAAAALAPGGSILVSVPNVTHGAVRLELLSGKFRYRDSGLLDRGHLRFFDREGVDELIREAGLRAETTLRVMRRLDQTEFDIDLTNVPADLRSTLESDVEALTYQFFLIVRPASAMESGRQGASLLERLRARVDELSAEVEKGGAYARHVEAELAAKDARLRELEEAVQHVEREFDARGVRLTAVEQIVADLTRLSEDNTAYVRHLEGELQKRAGDIAIRDDELSVLRTHFQRAEKAIAERDALLLSANGTIAERDALLQSAGEREAVLQSSEREREAQLREREALLERANWAVAEALALTAHYSWVLQQPRHRLAETSASALKSWTPLLHRLLRPFVLAALKPSSSSAGSPPQWP